MAEKLDCVVVGAGVVGLAIGRALAISGREVVVLDAEPAIGMHSSSRNSEVIHAGIYYPETSLKARLCVEGRERLYSFCAQRGVPFQRIGKLIVATNPAAARKLDAIRKQASRNGVTDLRQMERDAVHGMEPAIECIAALFSPSTGIIDSHAYLLALQADIEAQGGSVVLDSRVQNLRARDSGFGFQVGSDGFTCSTLINCAGLRAAELVADIDRALGRAPAELRYAKGHYYAYQGKSPFRHLVYPVPVDGGLGIHATNDLGGTVRFGPDVTWVDEIDYAFDATRKGDFVTAIRSYFPAVEESRLVPSYTGIRPKLNGPGEPAADFHIAGERDHGVHGLVNLFGIESPGLTASLAIANCVTNLV